MSFISPQYSSTQKPPFRHVLEKLVYSKNNHLVLNAKGEIEVTSNLAKDALSNSGALHERSFELKLKDLCIQNESLLNPQDLNLIEKVAQKYFGGHPSELQQYVNYLRSNMQNTHRFQDVYDSASTSNQDDDQDEDLFDTNAGEESNPEEDQIFQFFQDKLLNEQFVDEDKLDDLDVKTNSSDLSLETTPEPTFFSTKNLTKLAIGVIGITVAGFLTKGLFAGSTISETLGNEVDNSHSPSTFCNNTHCFIPFENRKITPIKLQDIFNLPENIQPIIEDPVINEQKEDVTIEQANPRNDLATIEIEDKEDPAAVVKEDKNEANTVDLKIDTPAVPFISAQSTFDPMVKAVVGITFLAISTIAAAVLYTCTQKHPDLGDAPAPKKKKSLSSSASSESSDKSSTSSGSSEDTISKQVRPVIPRLTIPERKRYSSSGSSTDEEILSGSESGSDRGDTPSEYVPRIAGSNADQFSPSNPSGTSSSVTDWDDDVPTPMTAIVERGVPFYQQKQTVHLSEVKGFDHIFLQKYKTSPSDYPELLIELPNRKNVGLLLTTAEIGHKINSEISKPSNKRNFKNIRTELINVAKGCCGLLSMVEETETNFAKEAYAILFKSCNFMYACINKLQINVRDKLIDFPESLTKIPSNNDLFNNKILLIKLEIIKSIVDTKNDSKESLEKLLAESKAFLKDDFEDAVKELLTPYEIDLLIDSCKNPRTTADALTSLKNALADLQHPPKKSIAPQVIPEKSKTEHLKNSPLLTRRDNNISSPSSLSQDDDYQYHSGGSFKAPLSQFIVQNPKKKATVVRSKLNSPPPKAKSKKDSFSNGSTSSKEPEEPFKFIADRFNEIKEEFNTPNTNPAPASSGLQNQFDSKIKIAFFASKNYKATPEIDDTNIPFKLEPQPKIESGIKESSIDLQSINLNSLEASSDEEREARRDAIRATFKDILHESERAFTALTALEDFDPDEYFGQDTDGTALGDNSDDEVSIDGFSELKEVNVDKKDLPEKRRFQQTNETVQKNIDKRAEVIAQAKDLINSLEDEYFGTHDSSEDDLSSSQDEAVEKSPKKIGKTEEIDDETKKLIKAITPSKHNNIVKVFAHRSVKNGQLMHFEVTQRARKIITEIGVKNSPKKEDKIKSICKSIEDLSVGVLCNLGFIFDNDFTLAVQPLTQMLSKNELVTLCTVCNNLLNSMMNLKLEFKSRVFQESHYFLNNLGNVEDNQLINVLKVKWGIILLLASDDEIRTKVTNELKNNHLFKSTEENLYIMEFLSPNENHILECLDGQSDNLDELYGFNSTDQVPKLSFNDFGLYESSDEAEDMSTD